MKTEQNFEVYVLPPHWDNIEGDFYKVKCQAKDFNHAVAIAQFQYPDGLVFKVELMF